MTFNVNIKCDKCPSLCLLLLFLWNNFVLGRGAYPLRALVIMRIHFCEVNSDGTLDVRGGVENRNGAEGFSKELMWFLKQSPSHRVHKMFVCPKDSRFPVTSIPIGELVEWDYRLPVDGVIIALRAQRGDEVAIKWME